MHLYVSEQMFNKPGIQFSLTRGKLNEMFTAFYGYCIIILQVKYSAVIDSVL